MGITIVQRTVHGVIIFSGFYVSASASQEGCQALVFSPKYC